MDTIALIFIIPIGLFLIGLSGFVLGCVYTRNQFLIDQLKEKQNNVDNPIPAEQITLQDIVPHEFKPDNFHVPAKNPSKSRVMKYPSAEEIRKRHERENEERYSKTAEEPRESGTFFYVQ